MPQQHVLIITGGLYHDFPAIATFLKSLLTQHGFQLALHDRGITSEPQRIKYRLSQGYRYYENIADHLGLDDPLEITAQKAGRVIHVLHAIDTSARSGKPEAVSGEGR